MVNKYDNYRNSYSPFTLFYFIPQGPNIRPALGMFQYIFLIEVACTVVKQVKLPRSYMNMYTIRMKSRTSDLFKAFSLFSNVCFSIYVDPVP